MSIRTSSIQSKQASAGNKCQWFITIPQLSKFQVLSRLLGTIYLLTYLRS